MDNFETTYPTKNLRLLHKYDTEYSSDSVEFCPHVPTQNYFVCANYQLVENKNAGSENIPNKRLGRILLFSITSDRLILHQTIDTDAVLDQKWCHCQINGFSTLAVVNAKKTVEIYKLDVELQQLELVTHYTLIDGATETLILSADWSTGKYDSQAPVIVCSDSKGNIHRLIYENNLLCLENSWNAHQYEAWITAFDYWDSNIVFTGGDDSVFLKFDVRVGNEPVTKNKSHEAGVTCIHSNAKKEHVLASGSYDTYLRLWDNRNMKRPSHSIQLPGTMWRLKWDPFNHVHLLAACMLGGVHIVDTNNFDDLKIVESFYEHKNIAYGSDWCFLKGDEVEKYGQCDGNVIIGYPDGGNPIGKTEIKTYMQP